MVEPLTDFATVTLSSVIGFSPWILEKRTRIFEPLAVQVSTVLVVTFSTAAVIFS